MEADLVIFRKKVQKREDFAYSKFFGKLIYIWGYKGISNRNIIIFLSVINKPIFAVFLFNKKLFITV